MKGAWVFVIGALCGAAVAMLPRAIAPVHATLRNMHGGQTTDARVRAHTEEKFVFRAHAPVEQVAPLFGADNERVWSPAWEPRFIHPLPATDEPGMVFTVADDRGKSVWVNTEFDLKNGRAQYVYVIPDRLVTVIALKLTPAGNQTQVEVEYDRTALTAEADAQVQQIAEQDRRAGAEWEREVNGYLEKRKG